MGKSSRRSDKRRGQIFSYFIHKSPRPNQFSLRQPKDTAKVHDELMAKSRIKLLATIKAWLKAKIKSIFKPKVA